MAPAKQATGAGGITIPPINIRKYVFEIIGDTPLIVHAWSHKARQEMLDKQMGVPKAKKEDRNPDQEYEDSFYRLADGSPGFPSIAFKAAVVSAAAQIEGLTKVFLRGAFHTIDEMVRIDGEPRMRSDMVKIGMGTADQRFRPEFPEWSVQLGLKINANSLNIEQIAHLLTQAGFSVGIGEWRPERDGSYGMFHVGSIMEV